MAWPTSDVNTSNADAGTDNPATFRTDVLDLIGKFNQLRNHVSGFWQGILSRTTAAQVRADLGAQPIPAETSGTTEGDGSAYTFSPTTPITAYTTHLSFWVKFHVVSGANPTLQISGLASPPSLVRYNASGTLVNIGAGELPAGFTSRVTLLSATQALVEDRPVPLPALINAQAPSNYYASATLVAADLNRPIVYASGAPGTLTLPASPAMGQSATFYCQAGGVLTIARSGTSTIAAQGNAGLTSITIGAGDSICLVFNGDGWMQVLSSVQFGVAQSWQNVLSSRVTGVTYTNTTGKAIQVSVTDGTGTTSAVSVTVNGLLLSNALVAVGGSTNRITAWFIVPPGATYSVTTANAPAGWVELR